VNRQTRPCGATRAFTLIELIVVLGIVALLATLLIPVTESVISRSRNLKCQSNLRQIATIAHIAATDNGNRYVPIEIDPDDPHYPPEQKVKGLVEALKPWGMSEQLAQCPEDMKTENPWFVRKKTSYMWQPFSEDEPVNRLKNYTPRGAFPGKQSRVRLATDYEPVHPPDQVGGLKKSNYLYADGHVVAR
jgi:prepilin-type N-terminal cleavage/methylation domain-containing protein/prepilin-type processing-associated H-X9-DG protein